MYGGGNHTNIDLGLLEGHPLPLALGSMPPAGVKLSSFFKLFGSGNKSRNPGMSAEGRGAPGWGREQRPTEVFPFGTDT